MESSGSNPKPSPSTFSDAVFDATFETLPILIAVLDTTFNFLRVNSAYAAADNKDPGYFIGKNHFELFPNEENEAIFRRVRDTGIAHTATAKPFEYEHNPERGVSHWDWSLSPTFNGGSVTHLVLVLQDVTARVRDIESLARSERGLMTAQRVARVGSWEHDLVTDKFWWSDQMYALFQTESATWDVLQRVHPEDRDRIRHVYADSIARRAPFHELFRIVTPLGQTIWIDGRCDYELDQNGKPVRAIGTARDITERINAEQNARETTRLLDSIIEHIPEMIFVKSAQDLRFAHLNRAGEELLGMRRSELIGRTDYDFFPKDQADFFTATDRAVLAQQSVCDVPEEPIETPARGRRILHTRKIALRNDNGQPTHLLGISEDITDRKRTEQELLQFKETLDQTLDCVFMFDSSTLRFLYCNQGALDHIGYSRDELLSMTPLDIKPEFDETRFRNLVEPLISGVESRVLFRTVHRTKTGNDVPVEIALQLVRTAGNTGQFIAIVRDISSRIEAEKALIVANERLEEKIAERTRELRAERNFISTALDTAGALFVVMDRKGHVVRFNRACENLTGFRFNELRDKPIWEYVIPPEQRDGVRGVFEKLESTALPSTYENHWLRKDGSRFLVAWSNSTITDEKGRVVYVVATGIDITARKSAEMALRSAKEDAEQANMAKSEFLARMSHELRTPLNSILGFGQLLDGYSESRFSSTDRDCIREILLAGEHLLHLISDILDLSRIESGNLVVRPRIIGLEAMLRAVCSLTQPSAETRNITVIPHIETPSEPFVYADPTRLKQVLLNLISNAIKFNRAGGSVSIRCSCDTPEALTVRITDTGSGLTRDQIQRLFVPFERLDADKHAVEGTGIGLALSKQLVEMMNGQIGVESAPGVGSTFWIQLPLAHPELPDASSRHL